MEGARVAVGLPAGSEAGAAGGRVRDRRRPTPRRSQAARRIAECTRSAGACLFPWVDSNAALRLCAYREQRAARTSYRATQSAGTARTAASGRVAPSVGTATSATSQSRRPQRTRDG